MPIQYVCVGCRDEMFLPDHKAGQLCACPRCRLKFLAPAPNVASVPPHYRGSVAPQHPPASPGPPPLYPLDAPPADKRERSGTGLFGMDEDAPSKLFGEEDVEVHGLFGSSDDEEDEDDEAPAAARGPGGGYPGYPPAQAPQGHPGYPPQGYPPPGYPPQQGQQAPGGHPGYPPQGYPQRPGYPPQGYPPQGYPPQGYPPQGYPPQGYPPQGYPPQGYPPRGHPQQGHPGHAPPGHAPPGHGPPGHAPPGHGAPGHGPPGHGAPGYPPPGYYPGYGAPPGYPPAPEAGDLEGLEELPEPDDGMPELVPMGARSARGYRLVALEGLPEGDFSLPRGKVYLLGRDREADVKLLSTSVSRRQARIDATGSAPVLIDLGSANGTRVNGELVDRHPLKEGDLIKMGKVVLRFTTA